MPGACTASAPARRWPSIGKRYGVTPASIVAANNLRSPQADGRRPPADLRAAAARAKPLRHGRASRDHRRRDRAQAAPPRPAQNHYRGQAVRPVAAKTPVIVRRTTPRN